MRALARRLSSKLPRAVDDGIELVVGDPRLAAQADEFFARTTQALRCAATGAPTCFARLRRDLLAIVLRPEPAGGPYHRFQFAALVPPDLALHSDPLAYAAWLLYTSGLAQGRDEALARSGELLRTLDPQQRDELQRWVLERA